MKILCLIIDCVPEPAWRETYEVHRRAWNQCLDRCPDVEAYFLYADPNLAEDYCVEPRCFKTRSPERYDTIFHKTRRAIEVLLADHDYVVRTNTSSLYDFPLLQRQSLPRSGVYQGQIGDHRYVTGSGMILSRDVAQLLTLSSSQACEPWDDLAIAQVLRDHGIAPQQRDWFCYDYARDLDQVTVGTHVHYRLRDISDPYRVKERVVTDHVLSMIYPEQPCATIRNQEHLMSDIDELYVRARETPSDISEHVERLRQLGEKCRHVTEFGVRWGTSTVAWVAARPEKLVCYDVRRYAEVDAIEHAAKMAGVEFVFHIQDVLEATIDPTDLLFIDTLHTYDQLRDELAKHAAQVSKYIVLHDTETFGQQGELPGARGIWLAVEEFLETCPEWKLSERRRNNNGLTVLARDKGME